MSFARCLSRPARRNAAPRTPVAGGGPSLEPLADRVAPAGASPPATAITDFTVNYGLFQQIEKVSVQVTSAGAGVPQGQVLVSDNGQTQSVTLDGSGKATAVFAFNLF